MESISERISRLMKENNLKGIELSQKIGISSAALSKYINDKTNSPKAEVLYKMSKIFKVSMEYIMTGEIEDEINNKIVMEKFDKLNQKDKLEIENMIEYKLKQYDMGLSSDSMKEDKIG